MVKVIVLTAIFAFLCGTASAQSDSTKDRDLQIEIEPASFILKGYAASVSYRLTKDNNFSLGLYSALLDVPGWAKTQIFDNVADTTKVRLGFEMALMARYKFRIFKQWESNPYVGALMGWEYFDVTPVGMPTVRLSTVVLTPYLGYEIYLIKKILYINPQLRAVFYVGQNSNMTTRPERIGSFFMLPQISLGIRL